MLLMCVGLMGRGRPRPLAQKERLVRTCLSLFIPHRLTGSSSALGAPLARSAGLWGHAFPGTGSRSTTCQPCNASIFHSAVPEPRAFEEVESC